MNTLDKVEAFIAKTLYNLSLGKIWRVHAPPGGFTPPPRENPGSATEDFVQLVTTESNVLLY